MRVHDDRTLPFSRRRYNAVQSFLKVLRLILHVHDFSFPFSLYYTIYNTGSYIHVSAMLTERLPFIFAPFFYSICQRMML